jgi:hypothetical protein
MKLTAIAMLLASTVSVAAQQVTSFPPANLPLSGSETVYLVQGGNGRQTTVGNIGSAGGIGIFLPLAGNATVVGPVTFSGGITGPLTGVASGNLPLTGGTLSGPLTATGLVSTGTATIGQNASGTGGLFINGASTGNRQLLFETAGVPRWKLFTNNSEQLQLVGVTDANVQVPVLEIDHNSGSMDFIWPTITYSGTDPGTTLSSQPLHFQQTFAGSSNPSGNQGIVYNRFNINDTSTSGNQDTYLFLGANFGPGPSGGKVGFESAVTATGPVTFPAGGGGFIGMRASALGLNDGGATSSVIGGTVSAQDFVSDLPAGTTNWFGNNTIQVNMYTAVGNNLQDRVPVAIGVANDNDTQGGRIEAAIEIAWTPLTLLGASATVPPFVGAQFRTGLQFGCGCGNYWPIDAVNGTLIGIAPTISPYVANATRYGAPPQNAWRGIDISTANWSDKAWFSPGAWITGAGAAMFDGLQMSAGSSGPVIDAQTEVGSANGVTTAGTGYTVGEQPLDRLGGIASVDSVNGSKGVVTWHYLKPPRVVPGAVVQVGAALNDVAAPTPGTTVLLLRNQTVGMALGDTVLDAGAAGAFSSGTVITAIDFTSDLNHTKITISPGTAASLPAGEMMTFNLTMAPGSLAMPLGAAGTGFVGAITWTAPTSIGIATNSGLRTVFGGGIQLPGGTWGTGSLADGAAPIFQNATFTGSVSNGAQAFGAYLQQFDNGTVTTGGASGFGIVEALLLNSSSVTGGRAGAQINLKVLQSTGNTVSQGYGGAEEACEMAATDANVAGGGGSACFGNNPVSTIDAGVTATQNVGEEVDTAEGAGAIIVDRIGEQIVDVIHGSVYGVQGSRDDIALRIGNQYAPSSTLGFKVGFEFGGIAGNFPLETGGTMIGAAHHGGAFTVANGIDWHLGTATGNWLNMGGVFTVSGAGAVVASAYTAGTSAGVSCTGTPTSSFASVGGIVTHC